MVTYDCQGIGPHRLPGWRATTSRWKGRDEGGMDHWWFGPSRSWRHETYVQRALTALLRLMKALRIPTRSHQRRHNSYPAFPCCVVILSWCQTPIRLGLEQVIYPTNSSIQSFRPKKCQPPWRWHTMDWRNSRRRERRVGKVS